MYTKADMVDALGVVDVGDVGRLDVRGGTAERRARGHDTMAWLGTALHTLRGSRRLLFLSPDHMAPVDV